MHASPQTGVRLSIWAIAAAYILLHGLVATRLPEWLDPLSTFCIVLAEWAAIAALLTVVRRAALPTTDVMGTPGLLDRVSFHGHEPGRGE